MTIRMFLAAVVACVSCAVAPTVQAADGCSVVVTGAYKYPVAVPAQDASDETKKELRVVELGDSIEVTMTGLDKLNDCRPNKNLDAKPILYLAAQPLKGLAGYQPGPPADGKMRFDLAHNTASKAAWALVLANPWPSVQPLEVSVGFEDASPFQSSATIQFRKVSKIFFFLGLAFMAVLIVLFVCLLWFTDMCRDGRPAIPKDLGTTVPVPPTAYGPYSLSKVQAGIWFLVVLGAYIFIVAVTHDLSGTLNATALTLLGIGAATMVGSAAIQTNQGEATAAVKQEAIAKDLAQRIQQLKADVTQKAGTPEGARSEKLLTDMEFAFKRATNQSIGFWNDIVSDANGVNFHRFQMAAWTVVLAFIFAIAVTRILAMPDFDSTLLALQGLSAGTFLGLKVTEAKVTTVPGETPKVAETPPK
jgi:hypothetical protein